MRSLQNEKSGTSCGCEDPIECLRHMFCDMVQKNRVENQGQCPARRPVFLRTHGSIKGTLTFVKDLDKDLQHGLFANPGATHPVYVRYSSDLSDGRPDWMSTIGLGLKIFNVKGEKLVSDDGANTADMLFQNVPYFFVNNAKDMCGFTKASLEGWGDEWVQENSPITNQLLNDMAKPIRSVFEAQLWSVVPFKLGDSAHCKYVLRPGTSTFAGDPDINDPDFLAKDLKGRMALGPASLDIYIQKRPSAKEFDEAYVEEHFPLDRLTVTWDEKEAPLIKVASIELPQQEISEQEQEIYGDWLAFNIGRVPLANSPVGSIAEARMSIYQTSANYRRETNGQPVSEPKTAGEPVIKNPVCPFPHQKKQVQPVALTKEQIERITQVRIHPGIGMARLGNSQSDYYIGPEVITPPPTAFGSTRDAGGAIKRQAARFRIYGYDKFGNVVSEIQQSDNSKIEWSVQVANRKAAWYEFNAAMDIPATVSLTVPLRNPKLSGAARNALVIDSGAVKITGLNMNDSSYALAGNFQGTAVTLGELRTDAVGRLLVLPGFGDSASPEGKPIYDPANPDSFNNAAGWYDDIADGPVNARVTIGDRDFDADPAWVASAPPNYAPDLVGWRTMDDLMRNLFISSGMLPLPVEISFNNDVRPILQRLTEMQWVNKGYLSMFGADAPMDFNDASLMRKLSVAPISSMYPDPYMELRRTIYSSFRATHTLSVEEGAWPWNYGDAFGYTNPNPNIEPSASTYLKLPPYYDYILTNWVNGTFISDYTPQPKVYYSLHEVELQKQPEMLDRAAMHFCLADAFHPGAELTWPMRNASLYRAPYRIRLRQPGAAEPVYGPTLNNDDVAKIGGPLYGQGPGDLTRWMALPWQGDTAFCRSGYDAEYDPYLPTFWPTRVPNQVLTEDDYNTLCDKKLSMDLRIAAFQNRPSWLRQLPGQSPASQQMLYMVQFFGEMGVLESKPGPDDIDWLPENIYVENLTKVKKDELKVAQKLFKAAYAKLGPADKAFLEAGWFSEEQRNEFETIKRRGN